MKDKIRNSQFAIRNFNKGFTLIELIVVLGMIGILTTVSFTSIFTTKHSTSLLTSVTTFLSDTKEQQNKAMVGDTEGSASAPQSYGIKLGTTNYTLFRGQIYDPFASSNFTINLGDNIQFTNILLPTQAPSNEKVIVFATSSGEVFNFVNGMNSFVITNTVTNQQKTITVNKYGTITGVN